MAEMKTVLLNKEDYIQNGFQGISLVDESYCEIKFGGKTHLRQYYVSPSGVGHFYFNDTRYKIANIKSNVPQSKKKELQISAGDTVTMLTFSGKNLGNFGVQEVFEGSVRIIAGNGKTYIFDSTTGIQTNNENGKEKFANIIMLPEDANEKQEARKREINFGGKEEIEAEEVVEEDEEVAEETGTPKHSQYETIKTCISLDIPVYLVGEAGTGKNHTLQEIASDLSLEFYFTNSIQQEYKVTGFIDAGGKYHETEFYKAFKNGGLFFLDEMDASIPEVLVLLNAAIANKYFEFPNGRITAHENFRVVAAGNTLGSGANELYTGRLVLDSATLDRFAVIEFDYDQRIELALAKGNKDLVAFIRSLRDFCKKNGVRGTFSYRMIIAVQKLEQAKMPMVQILKIAVLKGLDKDTVRTLKVQNAGKYYHALVEAQRAV